MTDLPIIELGDANATAAIDQACRNTGFFAVVGHELDEALAEAFRSSRDFFALDQSAKEQVPRANSFGFVPQRIQALDSGRLNGNTEYLDIGLGADMGVNAAALGRSADEIWPVIDGFREAITTYQRRALEVSAVILETLAEALDVESSFFAPRMTHPSCKLRLLHYPPRPPGEAQAWEATAAHTDYGAITLLATDGMPGLQLKSRDGPWIGVEAPANALVVNLGDMLAVWTNLRFASTPHRVVLRSTGERYSIPFFVNPDPETVVEPMPSCVDAENPPLLEPITAGAFLAGRIDNSIPEPFASNW